MNEVLTDGVACVLESWKYGHEYVKNATRQTRPGRGRFQVGVPSSCPCEASVPPLEEERQGEGREEGRLHEDDDDCKLRDC